MARFTAGGTERDGFGVYDSVAGRWVTRLELAEATAESVADVLNERYGEDPGQGPELVEVRVPAVRVKRVQWQAAGTIDVLVKDWGEWYGRVRDEAGAPRWYPARDLRRTPPE